MHKLDPCNYSQVAPLFQGLAQYHLSVAAVCAGTAPGAIWVDQLDNPAIGFVETPEGQYLTGAVAQEQTYPALKALIPIQAYLTIHPRDWAAVLPQIWRNPVVRRHPRLHLCWQYQRLLDWRTALPPGFEVVAIDQDFLNRTDLQHHTQIVEMLAGWHSTAYFLAHGFGFCVLQGQTIVSRCMADCVVDDQCEIGVSTHRDYRGRGVATALVAATVEQCLTKGFRHIGWHCLRSNTGSRKLAEKVGFRLVAEYDAYSAVLPAENVGDLSAAEATEWALHYEQFIMDSPWYRLFAAEAWTLAGDHSRALLHLARLAESHWPGDADQLAQRWALHSLHKYPEFQTLLALLPQRTESEIGST